MRTKDKPRTNIHDANRQDRFEWDGAEVGLGIRYRSGRKPTWYFQTRINGKTTKRSLGPVSELSVAEAREIARRERDDLTGTTPLPTRAPNLPKSNIADFAERYLRDGSPNWKPATIKAHRYVLSRFIIPAFGERELASLTAEEVAAWWAGLDVTAGTRNRTLAVLSGLIRHAELLGLRSPGHNPCQGLRRRKSSFEAYDLTAKDYKRLGAGIQRTEANWPVEAAIIRFLALTGCRKSEARCLRWSMIDGRRAALPDSKTGPRAIWLATPALELLAEQATISDYVFSKRGKPVSNYQLDKIWHKVRASAGLPSVRLHDLRHGFASVAICSGETLRTVSGLLGHSDLQTTAGYAKFAEQPVRDAAARVAEQLQSALSATNGSTLPKPKPMVAAFLQQGLSLEAYAMEHGVSLSTLRQKLAAYFKAVRTARSQSEIGQ
ncbi:MAG: site-specific integrase [Pseudomonadaceae bacterium]|nr:site-specific integrase [Pseudomonadaceae bacterium]